MGYMNEKDYIVKRLIGLGYFEATDAFNFDSEGENVLDNRFIVQNPETVMGDETVVDRFYPRRTFSIQIAYRLSATGQTFEYDQIQDRVDLILKDLPNQANFGSSSILNVNYVRHTAEKVGDYLLVTIDIEVWGQLTYA